MNTLAGLLGFAGIVLIFTASQIFWLRQIRKWCARLLRSPRWRRALGGTGIALYLLLFLHNLPGLGRGSEPTQLTLRAALLDAPFRWWLFSSLLGFLVIALLSVVDRLARAARWAYQIAAGAGRSRSVLPSPERRRFLEQTGLALGFAPFVAGTYGLLYGRLNLKTTRMRIALSRLPKAFQGFRVVQLSDIHIGPFMSANEIRKYVGIANHLRPDIFVLTGDFLTWDPNTQEAVVQALAGLKAPFGIFGCLGNHELWTDTEDSITRLFAGQGIVILRQARSLIESQGEILNLIGVDFQSHRGMGGYRQGLVSRYLQGVEPLVMPDTVNILLSHNPNTFDRASDTGIDLSLAGHTHGGQVTLEFIHPSLSPGRLITPYVQGWFRKAASQLYVNRGIGTIGFPIRFDAPPEITVFELVRES